MDDRASANTSDLLDEPLVPAGECTEGHDITVEADADGKLAATRPMGTEAALDLNANPIPLTRPCSRLALNGSWLLTIQPQGPHLPQAIRGPMRIEATADRLRMSGDIYVRRLIVGPSLPSGGVPPAIGEAFVTGSLVIRRNWYPAFPQSEYRWYFRSLGVTYGNGVLTCRFERHLWNDAQQAFVSTDTGSMSLKCQASLMLPVGAPQPTLQMAGTMTLGGQTLTLTATKTSPHYRGCLVEIDVMKNRAWPGAAKTCDGGRSHDFAGVYREAGLDFRAVMNDLALPEDSQLSTAELHTLLATHRSVSAGGDNWHLWLLVGSRTQNGSFGVMFDTGNPPHREGAVGFFDEPLGSSTIIHPPARGKKLGEVPLAFLRTLIHEAGHAFNLFHPKHDVHGVPVGTTIMNQTGDVMGFATPANPYPCNATMAFNEHNRTSLIHSPDPQVKPSWKEFGWGHGSVWSGIAEPIDAAGLSQFPLATDLALDISLPAEAPRGEFVWAKVTLTNVGDRPREVTTALNLAEDDLRIHVGTPSGDRMEARDVLLVCGPRRTVQLAPGERISGQVQLFYGPQGLTFDQPGRYVVQAELYVGDGTLARSAQRDLLVRPAVSELERQAERLAMDRGVGLSIALGDFGTDDPARQRLATLAESHVSTDIGAAAALVLANSLARPMRDVRSKTVLRPAENDVVEKVVAAAAEGRTAERLAELAAVVVSPREAAAPILARVRERLERPPEGAYAPEDLAAAVRVLDDHLK